jgi:hypothetical protein
MAVQNRAQERRPFIDALAPLGLPYHVIAEAADCSPRSIKNDIDHMGGLKNVFTSRPTKWGEIYAKVFGAYFALQMDVSYEKIWNQVRPILEAYLELDDILTFVTGLNAGHLALVRSGLNSFPSEQRLLEDTFKEVCFEIDHTSVCDGEHERLQLSDYASKASYSGILPTSATDVKAAMLEWYRCNAVRANLRGPPGEDVVKVVRLVLATLTTREEYILRCLYGLGEVVTDLEGIARRFYVTKFRVELLGAKALRKLRHSSRSKRLLPLLGLDMTQVAVMQAKLIVGESERTNHKLQTRRWGERRGEVVTVLSHCMRQEDMSHDDLLVHMRRCIDLLDSTGEALLMSTTETVLLLRLDDWSPSISTRLSNSTGNAGIEFIFQLVERTEEEVLKTKNFGRKCLNEVKELLADLSMRYRLVEPVRLGMTLPKSTVDRVRQTIRWS